MNRMKRIAIGISCVVIIAAVLFAQRSAIRDLVYSSSRPALPAAVSYQEVVAKTIPKETTVSTTIQNKPVETKTSTTLPAELNLNVPFTSQAPTGNWGQPFQDACEEASVFMVHEYYAGNKSAVIDPTVATKALEDIVALENSLLGYYKDTTASETAQFAEKMYGYAKSEIISNPTVDQIKAQLNAGNPVLVPADGQLLNNPYFTPPGPPYHLIVIRGYTKNNQFITNDPGTKHGSAYLYSFDTIMNAMHDWNQGDVTHGNKVILILHPSLTPNP